MNDERNRLPHFEVTGNILSCCFEVMKELGPGFQERIYKNALLITLKQRGLQVEVEKPFEVLYRGILIGRYSADLVVEQTVIVELKCCENLVREHQAQLFNYLNVSQLPVGLLVNFHLRKLEYKRLHRQENYDNTEETVKEEIHF
jgi:GxxExxY protein